MFNMKQALICRVLYMLILCVVGMLFVAEPAQGAPVPVTKRGSRVIITFRNIPAEDKANVDGPYTISARDGSLKLPYIAEFKNMDGKTARDLEDKISAAYKEAEIYAAPIVSVQVGSDEEVEALNMRYIQVTGYVAQKRNLLYRPGITLIEALLECGGITDYGSREIQVTRGTQTQTYDYFSASDRAIKLNPNDVINVQKRGPFESRPSKVGP